MSLFACGALQVLGQADTGNDEALFRIVLSYELEAAPVLPGRKGLTQGGRFLQDGGGMVDAMKVLRRSFIPPQSQSTEEVQRKLGRPLLSLALAQTLLLEGLDGFLGCVVSKK